MSNQAALEPDFVEPISLKPLDGFIPFEVLWNCLDLQLCNFMVMWLWPWIFKVKFWKCCISSIGRAYWHGIKWMWINRMLHLHPLCDFQLWPQPWPWPWIFRVKFWKSRISGMGWPIDIELKGCESIECWTQVVNFNVHLTHDLDLVFSRANFENAVSQEWDGRLTWNERDVSL